jgi:hypothetical protein
MANQSAVGGNIRYPSLQSIGDLFRVSINDTMNSTTGYGTGTGNDAGLIMGNQNPDLVTFMDSAIQEVYSDLRNVGDPELIIDNYILFGIPALTQQNPAVQVALGYQGYFDGYQWYPQWTLPIGVSKMLAMWERQSSGGSSTSSSGSTVTPLYFRVRGAVSGGSAAVDITVVGNSASASGNVTSNEIFSVPVAGGTEIALACEDSFTGTLYFEASADGDAWFSTPPGSTTVDLDTVITLPLPAITIPGSTTPQPSAGGSWSFVPMKYAPFGLPGGLQGLRMNWWEMREGMIWMPGAIQAVDLRLRARINYPVPLYSSNLNYSTAYVPILDSRNAIVAKMLCRYAMRFAPELKPAADADDVKYMGKLRMEVVRGLQAAENERQPFGEEATADFNIAWGWL